MRVRRFACLFLAALAGGAQAQGDLLQYLGRMPQCGIDCILQEVPLSQCSSVLNATCICSDRELYSATQKCVKNTCKTSLDAIDVAKIEAEACGRPVRDRRYIFNPELFVLILGAVATSLRLYGRWSLFKSFMKDDWIMLACLILYIPFVVMGQYSSRIAFGQDIWTVDPENITLGLKLFYAAQSLYILCLSLPKIALLLFLLQIFPNKGLRWLTHTGIFLTSVSTFVLVFIEIFQCTPISHNWEGWKGDFKSFKCVNVNALALSAAGISIGLDALILILPLPLLVGLNMPKRAKAGILVMFSLGIFVLTTACIRLRYIILYRQSLNPTWDHTDSLLWSGLEVAVSMIVTSLPAVRILLRDRFPNTFSRLFSRRTRSTVSGSRVHHEFGDTARQTSTNANPDHEFRRIAELEETEQAKERSKLSRFVVNWKEQGDQEGTEVLELRDQKGRPSP